MLGKKKVVGAAPSPYPNSTETSPSHFLEWRSEGAAPPMKCCKRLA